MSIWSLFAPKSKPALSLEQSNTLPAPPPESCAPAVPTSMWEKAYQDSIRPFEAEAIGALRTHRGVMHNYERPTGTYKHFDHAALREVRIYARAKRADQFRAAAEASAMVEAFFNDGTFVPSNDQQMMRRAG